MLKVVATLPEETVIRESGGFWGLKPVFLENPNEPNSAPTCTVEVLHWQCKDQGKWENCSLSNREEFKAGDFPEYTCKQCGSQAPREVVEEKLLARKRYRGFDPRTDRRAAILATREKRKRNQNDR
jgi:hypothetical protein